MRHVRFLQALALVSAAGCSTRTIDEGVTDPHGTCVDKSTGTELGCSAGRYCTYFGTALDCTAPADGGTPALAACGNISCDTNHCSCSTTSASTCECTSAVIGPLAPPDLPA